MRLLEIQLNTVQERSEGITPHNHTYPTESGERLKRIWTDGYYRILRDGRVPLLTGIRSEFGDSFTYENRLLKTSSRLCADGIMLEAENYDESLLTVFNENH
jgi:hypothetical protein